MKLVVIDDHSSSEFLSNIKTVLRKCPIPYELISLPGRGNNASMKYCYEYAKRSEEDLIYFVEDDYLHSLHCLEEMLLSYDYFKQKMTAWSKISDEVSLMPVDNLFHYQDNTIFPSPVVLGPTRHWRINFYSNWTLLIAKESLINYWDIFWKFSDYSLDKPETFETNTIEPLFKARLGLLTPIPSLALHVATEKYISPFIYWENWAAETLSAWEDNDNKLIPINVQNLLRPGP